MTEHEQIVGILRAKNTTTLRLNPSHTALMVVDMQRYFTQPSHPFTAVFDRLSPGAAAGYLRRVRETVIPSIQRLLDCFRTTRSLIVFTTVGSETGQGNDLPGWMQALDALGLATLG